MIAVGVSSGRPWKAGAWGYFSLTLGGGTAFPVVRLPQTHFASACSRMLPSVLLGGDTCGHGPFPGKGGEPLTSPATPATPPVPTCDFSQDPFFTSVPLQSCPHNKAQKGPSHHLPIRTNGFGLRRALGAAVGSDTQLVWHVKPITEPRSDAVLWRPLPQGVSCRGAGGGTAPVSPHASAWDRPPITPAAAGNTDVV